MAKAWQLIVRARGETAGADAALKRLGKNAKATGAKLTSVGKTLTTHVTLPIVAAGVGMVKLATDAAETANKMQAVFGPATKGLNANLDVLAKRTGASRYAMREQAATIGALVKGLGLSNKATADMSLKTVALAKDLSSFHNIAEDDALEKLRAGLTGEAEPLKALGILIDEATVKQVAYANGIAKTGTELTQKQKLQARYLAIMQQAGKQGAVGDAARTANGLANRMKALKNSIIDTGTQMGTILLPYATKLVAWLQKLTAKFQGLSPRTQKIILVVAALAAAIGPLLVVIGTAVTAFGAISAAIGAVSLPVVAVVAGIVALGVGLVIAYKKSERFREVIHKGVIPAAKILWRILKISPLGITIRLLIRFAQSLARGGAALKAVKQAAHLAWTILRNSPLGIIWRLAIKLVSVLVRMAGGWGAVGRAINSALSWVEGMVNRIISAVGTLTSKLISAGDKIASITSAGGKANPLNWFASGGIVTGPQLVGVGEAGPEAIVPLGSGPQATRDRRRVMAQAGLAGGGGGNITVHQHFRGEPDMFAASRAARASFRGRFA